MHWNLCQYSHYHAACLPDVTDPVIGRDLFVEDPQISRKGVGSVNYHAGKEN